MRWELIQEEKKIMKELEGGKANDALDTRLGEVSVLFVVSKSFSQCFQLSNCRLPPL